MTPLDPVPSLRPRAITLAILAGALLHQAFKLAADADDQRRLRQRDLRDGIRAFDQLREDIEQMDHRCTFEAPSPLIERAATKADDGGRCIREAAHTGCHTIRHADGGVTTWRRDGRVAGVAVPHLDFRPDGRGIPREPDIGRRTTAAGELPEPSRVDEDPGTPPAA